MRNESTVNANVSTINYEHISRNTDVLLDKPDPFLKWAGGKGQLLSKFGKYFPKQFNNYIEPFLGGGAVFFHLFSSGKFDGKKITLIDSNADLLNCYKVIKNDVDPLIASLSNGLGILLISLYSLIIPVNLPNPSTILWITLPLSSIS